MYISKSKISYPISIPNDELFIKRTLSIHITETEDNDFINSLLESATEETEGLINQDIAYTNNVVTLGDFSGSELIINQGNLNSITSIINNDSSTLINDYEVKKCYAQFIIKFGSDINCESLIINFTTGWQLETEVPKPIKQAIVFKALGFYDKTDAFDSTCERLCQSYKLL